MTSFYKKICLLFLLIGISSGSMLAQQANANAAFGGGDGIFVYLSPAPASVKYPSGQVTGFRLERRTTSESNWQRVAEYESPADKKSFEKNLRESLAKMPYQLPGLINDAGRIWDQYEKYKTTDSISKWMLYLPVQMAFGTTWYDKDIRRKIDYHYRITWLDRSKNAVKAIETKAASFPGKADFPTIGYLSHSYDLAGLAMRFWMKNAHLPSALRVERKIKANSDWQVVNTSIQISEKKDSILFSIIDASTEHLHVYQYRLIPMDYYGNPGKEAVSSLVGAYDYRADAPVVKSFTVSTSADEGGMVLEWELSDYTLLISMRILRSTDRDGQYEQIAEVPFNTIAYLDQTATPMQRYFYSLQPVGPLGEVGGQSVRVFGLYENTIIPETPDMVFAEGKTNGVLITFAAGDLGLAGYRVYRSDGPESDFVEISGLVRNADSVIQYLDTSSTLLGSVIYGYMVRTQSLSHLLSEPSDTLFARPLKPTTPQMVSGLSVGEHPKGVQLYWDNMEKFDPTVAGYFVSRRDLPNGKFSTLHDTLLEVEHSHYLDTRTTPGKKYEYTVETMDVFGGRSKQCSAVLYESATQQLVAPGGLQISVQQEGIYLAWSAVEHPNLASYKLYRYERGYAPKLIKTIDKGSDLNYTDNTATKGKLYFYYVTSYATDKTESGPSLEGSVRR